MTVQPTDRPKSDIQFRSLVTVLAFLADHTVDTECKLSTEGESTSCIDFCGEFEVPDLLLRGLTPIASTPRQGGVNEKHFHLIWLTYEVVELRYKIPEAI